MCQNLEEISKNFEELELMLEYAIKTNSYLEVFAELMTKITTQALDKDLKVIRNPLDNLPVNMPQNIRYELERILEI